MFIQTTIFYFIFVQFVFSCRLKECENWKITVVPLLTESFDQINVLRALVTVLIEDCQWFAGHVEVHFLTNQHHFLQLRNFEEAASFVLDPNEFMYTKTETEFAYILAVESAIAEMPKAESNSGRYVFIVTDFERNNTASKERELKIIDRQLKYKGIQMRSIRLDSSGTIKDPNALVNVQRVRNVSSRFIRVSFTETNNIMDEVKPCRPRTEAERIRNIQYERDFQFRYWLANNTWDVTVGFVFFVSAIMVAVASIVLHLWNTRRKKAKDFLNNLQGLGTNLSQMNKATM